MANKKIKLLYSVGDRIGGDIQLNRFLLHNKHEIKIAAYLRSSESLTHIDWTLNALSHKYNKASKKFIKDVYGHYNGPVVGSKELCTLMDDICLYDPDLIICDFEPIVANIAKSLGKRLWYCSAIHLLEGIKWQTGQMRYFSLLDKTRRALSRLPKAEKTLIYSPFGDIKNGLELKKGYKWVRPYYYDVEESRNFEGIAIIMDPDRVSILSKILNCIQPFNLTLFSPYSYYFSHMETRNDMEKYKIALSNCRWLFTTGETSYISDAIYNKIDRVCIAPNLKDPESMLNATLCSLYNIGDNVGQIEYMQQYAIEEIERSYNSYNKINYLDKKPTKYLHEEIHEICSI